MCLISEYPTRIPDVRGAAYPFRGKHDANKSDASFSEELQVVKCIKRGVAILNRKFIAMQPLEVYHVNQEGRKPPSSGIGPVYSAPLYLQRGQANGNFSTVFYVASAQPCGAGPKQWVARRCVPVA